MPALSPATRCGPLNHAGPHEYTVITTSNKPAAAASTPGQRFDRTRVSLGCTSLAAAWTRREVTLAGLAGISANQCTVGDDVDQPWYAARALVQRAQGGAAERTALGAGYHHPVPDIGPGFVLVEGLEVITRGNALGQLAQVLTLQQLPQLGLPQQHHLQQFFLGCFQVGQQANLFQGFRAEVLRLVDHDHDAVPAGMLRQQVYIQLIDQRPCCCR